MNRLFQCPQCDERAMRRGPPDAELVVIFECLACGHVECGFDFCPPLDLSPSVPKREE